MYLINTYYKHSKINLHYTPYCNNITNENKDIPSYKDKLNKYIPDADKLKQYIPDSDKLKQYVPDADTVKQYIPDADTVKQYIPDKDTVKQYMPSSDILNMVDKDKLKQLIPRADILNTSDKMFKMIRYAKIGSVIIFLLAGTYFIIVCIEKVVNIWDKTGKE